MSGGPRRWAAVLVGLALAAGCRAQPPSPAGAVQRYEVAGVVRALPDGRGATLLVHHEAIPGFLDERGERGQMPAMSMPLPLAPGVALPPELAAGDAIDFTLEIAWGESPPARIVALAERETGSAPE